MTSNSPRVLVVGYAAFDTILPVDGPPPADAKVKVDDMVEGGGGPGATAAVALRRLGADVLFLGVLTDDPAGRIQRAELEAAGVDTVKELRNRNAENLAAKMNEINGEKKLSKGSASMDVVKSWIEQAQGLVQVSLCQGEACLLFFLSDQGIVFPHCNRGPPGQCRLPGIIQTPVWQAVTVAEFCRFFISLYGKS